MYLLFFILTFSQELNMTIDIDVLSSLFEMSNIMEGVSVKKVKDLGGELGLVKHFKSDINVNSYFKTFY